VKILHLDSSILGDGSASRTISAAIVDQLRLAEPEAEVTYRDLAAEPIAHLTLDTWATLDQGPDVRQFLESDIVVIGAGFYNFSIPSQLKAWIDRIAVRGMTFRYDESGVVGLATNKRIIIGLARGNVYNKASPFQSFEHAETLLRSVFTFLGAQPEFIIAEGIGRGVEARQAAISAALTQARGIAEPANPA
jgi:FMN-dependent NADH-azoreductase